MGILTQVTAPRSLRVVPGPETEVKFQVGASFPNSDWQAENTDINPFSLRHGYLSLVDLTLRPGTMVWQPSGRGPPKYVQTDMWVAPNWPALRGNV